MGGGGRAEVSVSPFRTSNLKTPARSQVRGKEPANAGSLESVPPPPVVSDSQPLAPRPSWWTALYERLGSALVPSSRGRFFQARLAVLLTILGGVLLWAGTDYHQRRARTTWQRPLRVALILVERERIEPSTIDLITSRARELERRLADEYRRHDGRDFTPFSLLVSAPISVERPPPAQGNDGALGLLTDTVARWLWTRAVDARGGIDPSAYDARIYLVMKPARGGLAFVEGESELGGRVGIAQADIAPDMIDFSLFVAAHELMHTLGASDKYDADGRALYPAGFAEPARAPLFPQPGAELMARNRPLSASCELPPSTLDELFVGDVTARELGWRR